MLELWLKDTEGRRSGYIIRSIRSRKMGKGVFSPPAGAERIDFGETADAVCRLMAQSVQPGELFKDLGGRLTQALKDGVKREVSKGVKREKARTKERRNNGTS